MFPIGSFTADLDGTFSVERTVPAGVSLLDVYMSITGTGVGTVDLAQWGLYDLTALGINTL